MTSVKILHVFMAEGQVVEILHMGVCLYRGHCPVCGIQLLLLVLSKVTKDFRHAIFEFPVFKGRSTSLFVG